MSKAISKYIAASDQLDKILLALSSANGGISSASFVTVIGASVGKTSASLSLVFSISNRIAKTLLKTIRNEKKKHDKIALLARSTLNSIEKIVSNELTENEITHEEFTNIVN